MYLQESYAQFSTIWKYEVHIMDYEKSYAYFLWVINHNNSLNSMWI